MLLAQPRPAVFSMRSRRHSVTVCAHLQLKAGLSYARQRLEKAGIIDETSSLACRMMTPAPDGSIFLTRGIFKCCR